MNSKTLQPTKFKIWIEIEGATLDETQHFPHDHITSAGGSTDWLPSIAQAEHIANQLLNQANHLINTPTS